MSQMMLDVGSEKPMASQPTQDQDTERKLAVGDVHSRGDVFIFFNRSENLYDHWPSPTCIVSDGPYGLGGFPGDPPTPKDLLEWYRPHVKAWSDRATPLTTLWFWNSEIGWATVHPLLLECGWEYRACHVWDKGLGHIAGNSNTTTLRKFPVVTEVCVQYVMPARFQVGNRTMNMQEWLRYEWKRSRLPFKLANQACGVANAATRKYLTVDHMWYFPPVDAFARMSDFVNANGDESGRPYFSIDGIRPVSGTEWSSMRAKFRCSAGITNVWSHPQVAGSERVNGIRRSMKWKYKSLHGSQKPLKLVELTVVSTTDPLDIVWEPFGGLCPAAICSWKHKRKCYSAEILPEFFSAAVHRLECS